MLLVGLLREFHEAIEFDFDDHGWDIQDFYQGRISQRKMLLRIMRLPRTSATKSAISPEDTAWSTSDHLLATVIDVLATANWQRGGDPHAKRPTPMKRPSKSAAKAEENVRDRALALRERTRQRQVTDG